MNQATRSEKVYKSQCARDAQNADYGSESYWDYLEQDALSKKAFYEQIGCHELASEMMTRSLWESLAQNNGY
jgi:hypothetical protein